MQNPCEIRLLIGQPIEGALKFNVRFKGVFDSPFEILRRLLQTYINII